MLYQKLRRSGNSYVVTIPKEVVEENDWQEGDLIGVDVYDLEITARLPVDVQAALDKSWERNEAGYRYLAGR